MTPADFKFVEPVMQDGEGWVEARVPRAAMASSEGPRIMAGVVTLMRAREVPVIGTSMLLGVESGTLFFVATSDGQTLVYRWRA